MLEAADYGRFAFIAVLTFCLVWVTKAPLWVPLGMALFVFVGMCCTFNYLMVGKILPWKK